MRKRKKIPTHLHLQTLAPRLAGRRLAGLRPAAAWLARARGSGLKGREEGGEEKKRKGRKIERVRNREEVGS